MNSDLMIIVFVLIFGLIVGSFLNCLVYRLYHDVSLLGRSFCPHCLKKIAWYDNIPVFSYILLLGRCRHCRRTISWQYPAVELFTALLFLLTWPGDMGLTNFFWLLLYNWLLVSVLIIISIYDSRWQLIPVSVITVTGLILLIVNIILGEPVIFIGALALLGATFFGIQYLLTKGRGIGEGDIWLGAFLGLAFPHLGQFFLIIFITYLLGAAVGIYLMISEHRQARSAIALGPFLALAAFIVLVWGEPLLAWYLQIVW